MGQQVVHVGTSSSSNFPFVHTSLWLAPLLAGRSKHHMRELAWILWKCPKVANLSSSRSEGAFSHLCNAWPVWRSIHKDEVLFFRGWDGALPQKFMHVSHCKHHESSFCLKQALICFRTYFWHNWSCGSLYTLHESQFLGGGQMECGTYTITCSRCKHG